MNGWPDRGMGKESRKDHALDARINGSAALRYAAVWSDLVRQESGMM